MRVIGMGAQDSLGQAFDFLEVTGVATPTMVWDPGFDSWTYYGVTGQPTIILVDPSGNPIQGWRGRFSVDEVLQLASEV